jgi:AcrR family transcriptional regulator
MGRPREFDVDEALQTAMQLFWRKGYEGTSLHDLTEGMGITKPSLYSYFGNKEELFYKALARYEETKMKFFYEALEEPSPRKMVERILRGFVDAQTVDTDPCGCMSISSALACSEAAAKIQQSLIESRHRAETLLAKKLEQARDNGARLPANHTPCDFARYVMTIAQGTAVQAASGAERDALYRVVDMSLQLWPEPALVD